MASVDWPSTEASFIAQSARRSRRYLTGWWNFNDASDLGKDFSYAGNDGVVTGAAYDASGASGGCLLMTAAADLFVI